MRKRIRNWRPVCHLASRDGWMNKRALDGVSNCGAVKNEPTEHSNDGPTLPHVQGKRYIQGPGGCEVKSWRLPVKFRSSFIQNGAAFTRLTAHMKMHLNSTAHLSPFCWRNQSLNAVYNLATITKILSYRSSIVSMILLPWGFYVDSSLSYFTLQLHFIEYPRRWSGTAQMSYKMFCVWNLTSTRTKTAFTFKELKYVHTNHDDERVIFNLKSLWRSQILTTELDPRAVRV